MNEKILNRNETMSVLAKNGLSAEISEVHKDGYRHYVITRDDSDGKSHVVEKGVLLHEHCDKFDRNSIRIHMNGYLKNITTLCRPQAS